MKKKYLEVGKIVATRGLNGELKVESWCDSPDVICRLSKLFLDGGTREVKVTLARIHKSMVLIKIEGIDDVESACKLRGKVLYAERDSIPKERGSYFIQDLISMEVIDIDNGTRYGEVVDIFKTGANDVYVVRGGDEKKYYVPAIPNVVVSIDEENEQILIRPIKGIFDDDV